MLPLLFKRSYRNISLLAPSVCFCSQLSNHHSRSHRFELSEGRIISIKIMLQVAEDLALLKRMESACKQAITNVLDRKGTRMCK